MDWKRIFDGLGMNGTRWQWRMMRWERTWKAFWHGDQASGALSLTRALIYVNVALFIGMILFGLATGWGLSPVLTPDTQLLADSGGQYWPYTIRFNQWWRCITYAYTHGGIIHLGFNMMVLYQVGPMIENEIGSARFFVLYTLTALAATAAGYLWHPMVVVVGASGSLFGLIGFAITYCHRLGEAGRFMRDFMFKWAVFAFIFGFLVGADNAAHLGGAVSGALIGLALPLGARGRQKLRSVFNLLAGLSVLATIASLSILLLSWVLHLFSGA